MPNGFCVPQHIDPTGATDVTAALQAWIDVVPDGAPNNPNVLLFDPTATYNVLGELVLTNRHWLTLDGQGCEFLRTQQFFAPIPNTTMPIISAVRDADPTIAIFEHDGTIWALDDRSRVQTSGFTPSQYNLAGEILNVVDATHFRMQMASDPGGSATVIGTASRLTRRDCFFVLTNTYETNDFTEGVSFNDMTITGKHTEGVGHSSFNRDYEYNHGFLFVGPKHVWVNATRVQNVYGDAFTTADRSTPTDFPCEDINLTGTYSYWIGRQGWALNGVNGFTARNNTIDDIARSVIDIEPTADMQTEKNILVEDLLVKNAYGTGSIVANKGANGDTDRLTLRRVRVGDNNDAQMTVFWKGTPPTTATRNKTNLLIEDCYFRSDMGAGANNGDWTAFHLDTLSATYGWQYVTIRNNYVEDTHVTPETGGLTLLRADSVTTYGNTFVNMWNYGGTPSWYKDGGSNTNVSVA